jgi:UDP-glucose 4-epimerase
MAKKLLVTGGAGYIGSHCALEMINSGYEVVIIDNFCNSSRGNFFMCYSYSQTERIRIKNRNIKRMLG